jgi:drug/metabolite transporter (DMT)-like permease
MFARIAQGELYSTQTDAMKPLVFENRPFSPGAALLTCLLCMLFGANAVAIKISLSGLSIFFAAGLRFGIAALVLMAWARLTGRPLGVPSGSRLALAGVCLLFSLQLALFYMGLNLTVASRATLLVNLQPFFMLFLAHAFIPGDRITPRKAVGLLLGFGGVACVFLDRQAGATLWQLGDAAILAAAFVWACNAVITKRLLTRLAPFQVVFYPMLLAAALYCLQALVCDDDLIVHSRWQVWAALLYQSLVTAAFGFVAWNTLLQRYGAVALHSFIFIMPVTGVLLGGLIMRDPITVNILLAGALIAVGLLVIHAKPPLRVPILHLGRNI